ncbi:pre-piRNA 3'-exonuclease trimmer isoform X2 [Harpegnathos saltator]|nr:pre-piRNA 3'-exonuclease trimmer isoform X2 [Harpegnathos saltator]XP_025157817.1 pre-piRNA 3'-exonuclease trimmer isoform X2 [Harpegnathos saltator]
MEFLAEHEFDFNKLAHHSIPYIDEQEKEILQQQIQQNTLIYNIKQVISFTEEDTLKNTINEVAKWLATNIDETNSFKIKTSSPNLQYLMHKELRKHFPNIWTLSGNESVTVIKVEPNTREILSEEEDLILENALLESYMGFSKVFNLLVTLKKPIIGHNVLLDLMFMYQQFYKPLPRKYIDFKNNIHKLFPLIYDTKFLSFELREILDPQEKWKTNSLGGLFDYFTKFGYYSDYDLKYEIYSPVPKIRLNNELIYSDAVKASMKCHTAGWDSYFTGYIFIKMAFKFTQKYTKPDGPKSKETSRYVTHKELMHRIQNFANCINIIRGRMSYLKLNGHEPPSTRPKWLYVKTLTAKPITEMEIYEEILKFGPVDVKKLASDRILVAVGNHGSARDILQWFRQNKELHVVPYSAIRHSPSVQLALVGGVLLSSGLLAWIMHQRLEKTS